MRNQLRHKLGISLTLALATVALSATSAIAMRAPMPDTGATVPACSDTKLELPRPSLPDARDGVSFMTSPVTG